MAKRTGTDDGDNLAPKRPGCGCPRHGIRLLPKFAEEGYDDLQCYCGVDRSVQSCQCTDPPWDGSLIAVYVGQDQFESPSEWDDSAKPLMYRIGRSLHCVVRAAANSTEPAWPPAAALSEYEDNVFGRSMEEPYGLRVSRRKLEGFFWKRTIQRKSDVARRHKPWGELPDGDEAPEIAGPSEPPIFTGGRLSHEILHIPECAWRTTWKVVFLLEFSGLAKSRSDAYAMIERAGWPEENRGTVRSHVFLGNGYMRERKLKRLAVRHQGEQLRRRAEREGFAAIIPLIFTPEEQQTIVADFTLKWHLPAKLEK